MSVMDIELEAVEVTVEEEATGDEIYAKNAPPFNIWNGVVWGSSGWICTIGGSIVMASMDRSGCSWWWALVVTPPIFFVIGIMFQYFVIEKRTHPLFCCLFPPSHHRRTGALLIAAELFTLLISALFILADVRGGCPTSGAFEWIACAFIGCVLLLSIFKDVFAVLPPPRQYSRVDE